ncbi:MAG: hypothetical protein ACW97O_17830 [Candidatus Thorarchaeota archaeon]|jgi:hypothetical protein
MSIFYSNTKERHLVYVNGKIVGTIENNTFTKQVTGSKHQLRRPPAWSIDAQAFDEQIKPQADEIVIFDKESGIKYHTPVETFDQFKRELDRGFGRQYYLTLDRWSIQENGNRQLGLWRDGDGH